MAEKADFALERIERPDPMSAEVARRLLDYLLSGEVKSGQRIPSERQLALSLGVGRSAIREAIKPLQLFGLVDVRIGDGTYLQEADSVLLPRIIEWGLLLKAHKMLELVEARKYVEVALAGLAADRRDDAIVARLKTHMAAMKSSVQDPTAFAAADAEFHLAIGEAAQNSVLTGLINNLRSLLGVWIGRVLIKPGEAGKALVEHRAILAAIEKGDRAQAELAMGKHIDRVTVRLKESLGDQ